MQPRVYVVIFRDRAEAGRFLGNLLQRFRGARRGDVVVLALPRGGVPVGYEVARALDAPLDVFIVRKLGLPGHEELAMGAIASGGVRVVNEEVVDAFGVPPQVIERAAAREAGEIARRERLLRGGRPPAALAGHTVILVDDGLATGSTMRAAIEAVRARGPARIVVAVPIAAAATAERLRPLVDDVVSAQTPETFYAVGSWYEDFTQTTDEEVRELLERAARERAGEEGRPQPGA